MRSRVTWLLALACAHLLLVSCGGAGEKNHIAQITAGGDYQRGAAAISRYGCGSCHSIPGISGAVGLAGPPLSGIASRIYLAGVMQNNPPNMIRWIRNPQAIDEKTVMPNLGVTAQDARDIAGYLYTLR